MDIIRNGLRPSMVGPKDWFTGSVCIDPLFDAQEPSRLSGAQVTFEAGARTHWHTHPLGQTLIVTSGCGQVQLEGHEIQIIHPGDVVRIAPFERHWHGASATTAMTHTALQEVEGGSAVTWAEEVTDEQFNTSGD